MKLAQIVCTIIDIIPIEKKIGQIVLEKGTFGIMNFPISYIHVDSIVIYNLRVVGSNPGGSREKHFI